MILSISRKESDRAKDHARFSFHSVKDKNELCQVITSKIWSPIIWDNGYRAKKNFKCARLIVLDFDSGEMTLENMKKECEDLGLGVVLATTKSHRPDSHRFRAIFSANSTCIDREIYEYNMKHFPEYWPCDPSCVDGARFFWPSRHVWHVAEGKTIDWLDFDEDYVPERLRFIGHAKKLRAMGENGMTPEWIGNILQGKTKVPHGERHKTLYRLGAAWQLLGFDLDLLESLVMKTSLRKVDDDYWAGDTRRALENGFKANEGYDVYLEENK